MSSAQTEIHKCSTIFVAGFINQCTSTGLSIALTPGYKTSRQNQLSYRLVDQTQIKFNDFKKSNLDLYEASSLGQTVHVSVRKISITK